MFPQAGGRPAPSTFGELSLPEPTQTKATSPFSVELRAVTPRRETRNPASREVFKVHSSYSRSSKATRRTPPCPKGGCGPRRGNSMGSSFLMRHFKPSLPMSRLPQPNPRVSEARRGLPHEGTGPACTVCRPIPLLLPASAASQGNGQIRTICSKVWIICCFPHPSSPLREPSLVCFP